MLYDLFGGAGSPNFAPATTPTLLGTAAADGIDPGIAVVALHSIASVREFDAPSATPALSKIRGASKIPPIGASFSPAINQPVGARNTGRGVATPQYRVTFKDGTPDGAVVYSDGNCLLALPAAQVKVELITPLLLAEGRVPGTLPAGLIVDAIATASVAWGEKNGSSAPFGMTTFSQIVPGVGGTPILFERPPFARRVVVIPARAGGSYVFTSSPSELLATPPAPANTVQQPQDVPAQATHVRFTLPNAAPAGSLVNVIWEIGVR